MGFLRRLLGGGAGSSDRGQGADRSAAAEAADPDADERTHELDLARFEQDRTDDLTRRQQRYADYSWTPPAQGGEQRADDSDGAG